MTKEPIDKGTLEALLALAESSDASACWGSDRATELLRTHSSREELRAAGASEALIAFVFEEEHGR